MYVLTFWLSLVTLSTNILTVRIIYRHTHVKHINHRALLCGFITVTSQILNSPWEYATNTIFSRTGSLMLRLASDWVRSCNPSVFRKKCSIACKYLQLRSCYSLFSHNNDLSSDLDTEAMDEKNIGEN